MCHFYPRSPCGERQAYAVTTTSPSVFLSTLSLRRATYDNWHKIAQAKISIHALLAESDGGSGAGSWPHGIFLSTLSLRRATHHEWSGSQQPSDFYPRSPCGERLAHFDNNIVAPNFYPRSPCGERLVGKYAQYAVTGISIHALLAESDAEIFSRSSMSCQFLSTLSLRRATNGTNANLSRHSDFYPRSPCGERQWVWMGGLNCNGYFYPRSPCGERPRAECEMPKISRFLSTLSLRRATTWQRGSRVTYVISIHALLAESDEPPRVIREPTTNFYPRSPCGERRVTVLGIQHRTGISIHALLAESDMLLRDSSGRTVISIHALLAESDHIHQTRSKRINRFLSTLSLRRATNVAS